MAVGESRGESRGTQPARGLVHERPESASVEWYTPPEVFERLALRFDLDPASPPGGLPWVPADRFVDETENGLWTPWAGRVWLNPPYGRDTPAWLDKLAEHGDGIALVFSRTDTRWFHRYARRADLVAFGIDRLHFIRSDGFRARGPAGSLFLAWGADCSDALLRSGLGTPMHVVEAS